VAKPLPALTPAPLPPMVIVPGVEATADQQALRCPGCNKLMLVPKAYMVANPGASRAMPTVRCGRPSSRMNFTLTLDTHAPVVTWGPVTDPNAGEDMTVLYSLNEPALDHATITLVDGTVSCRWWTWATGSRSTCPTTRRTAPL
jgi:hypothetical protein